VIFDSLGLGELGLVAVLFLLLVEPKKIAHLAKALGRFKRKWTEIQNQFKSELDALSIEEELQAAGKSTQSIKTEWRKKLRDSLRQLTAAEKAESAQLATEKLVAWKGFPESRIVAAFVGTQEEIDTDSLLREILRSGKRLLLPYVIESTQAGVAPQMVMAEVRDLERDLREGAFGILEPDFHLRNQEPPPPYLVIIPGMGFDAQGGRLGKGKGYYDRYLSGLSAVKLGFGFEAQVTAAKLPLETHDISLDGLVTETRLRFFKASRAEALGLNSSEPTANSLEEKA
jgi:5-formyltetrahydrofolate cyclo-ligase